MIKKFKDADIDDVMNIWKKAYMDGKNKISNEDFAKMYTDVRDILMDNSSDTILYTEDNEIEGFVVIDNCEKIIAIYVNDKIRREGIGSKLIDACKKKHKKLIATFKGNNMYMKFFEKNDFEIKSKSEDGEYTYQWEYDREKKINLIYFDSDLDEKLINKNGRLSAKKIELKEILKEDKNLSSVKNYVKIKRNIESAFETKVLIYLTCANYNEVINEIIKEIIRVEKPKIAIIVSEPLIAEGTKIDENLKKIEQSYKDYTLHKIDILDNIKKDVSINEIMNEKMGIIISEIEKIAENM